MNKRWYQHTKIKRQIWWRKNLSLSISWIRGSPERLIKHLIASWAITYHVINQQDKIKRYKCIDGLTVSSWHSDFRSLTNVSRLLTRKAKVGEVLGVKAVSCWTASARIYIDLQCQPWFGTGLWTSNTSVLGWWRNSKSLLTNESGVYNVDFASTLAIPRRSAVPFSAGVGVNRG